MFVVWIVIIFTMALSRWNVNITVLVAIIGIGGLAVSLAAQDTLSDAMSGVMILLDQPFRVGDQIQISELGTWGDVLEMDIEKTRQIIVNTMRGLEGVLPDEVLYRSKKGFGIPLGDWYKNKKIDFSSELIDSSLNPAFLDRSRSSSSSSSRELYFSS